MSAAKETFQPDSLKTITARVIAESLSHRTDINKLLLPKTLKESIIQAFDQHMKTVTDVVWKTSFSYTIDIDKVIPEGSYNWEKIRRDVYRLISKPVEDYIFCHWMKPPPSGQAKMRACCHKCSDHFCEAFGYELLRIEDRHFGQLMGELDNGDVPPKTDNCFCMCCGVVLYNSCGKPNCNISCRTAYIN